MEVHGTYRSSISGSSRYHLPIVIYPFMALFRTVRQPFRAAERKSLPGDQYVRSRKPVSSIGGVIFDGNLFLSLTLPPKILRQLSNQSVEQLLWGSRNIVFFHTKREDPPSTLLLLPYVWLFIPTLCSQ